MKPTKARQKRRASATPAPWKPALLAFGLTLAIGAAWVLLASLGAYFTPDPDRYIRPFALPAAALTYLCGGYLAARVRPEAPLASGAANGLLLCALSLGLSLFFRGSAGGYPAWVAALLHGGMILLSLLGAFLAVRQAKRPKKKKRRHA